LIGAPDDSPWPHIVYDDQHGALGALCAAIVREWDSNGTRRAEMLTLLIQQLSIMLQRSQEYHPRSAAEQLVQRAIRLFEERYAAPLRISEVAHELGVSVSHLRAQFTQVHGQSPSAYLQAVRERHALALLRTSTLSLEEIAQLCGFCSASHLSSHIKTSTGARPGVLRQQAQERTLS